uniref:Beta-galactosidase n=1 Tax=Heterorhabditis bacteriophora TaxID=37862 RepID=A0A1I7XHT3_HETBA
MNINSWQYLDEKQVYYFQALDLIMSTHGPVMESAIFNRGMPPFGSGPCSFY